MCGIAGIVRFNGGQVAEAELQRMMAVIKHRGPDDEGTMVAPGVGLGFVRLSILDLSQAGHQPMTDASGRYTLIYNGEIYNYIELRE
ncbi:MAG: asparagine synthetase B, partial [Bacteroidota bacterium]